MFEGGADLAAPDVGSGLLPAARRGRLARAAAETVKARPAEAVHRIEVAARSLPARLGHLAGREGWWFAWRLGFEGLAPEERVVHLILWQDGSRWQVLDPADAATFATLPARPGSGATGGAAPLGSLPEEAVARLADEARAEVEARSASALDEARERWDRSIEDALEAPRRAADLARDAWKRARAALHEPSDSLPLPGAPRPPRAGRAGVPAPARRPARHRGPPARREGPGHRGDAAPRRGPRAAQAGRHRLVALHLLGSGLRPMALDPEILDRPPAEGARIVAQALLAEARERAGRLGSPVVDDALHDFRVSVRRLRSTLRAWRDVLGPAVRDKDLRRLRRAARATGDARDAEVLLAWIGQASRGLPAAHRPAADWLARRLAREACAADLAVAGERFVAGTGSLARRLEGERAPSSGETFARAVADRIRRQASRVASRLSRVKSLDDAPDAHRARIEGKRLRYLLEPLRHAAGVDAEPAVEALKGLQDLLGELHDALAAFETLRAARKESAGPELRPGLAALEKQAAARAAAAFARLRREVISRGEGALLEPALAVAAALETRAERRLRPDHERGSGTRTRSAPGSRVQRAGSLPGCSPSTSSSTSAPSIGSASTTRARRQRVLGSFTWVPS